ncbi:MAG: hypothetical protein V2J12_07660 [Gammaproteobacteria bacterium]|nr:hypothetical protein [Gammaproteobacteria bacterium]
MSETANGVPTDDDLLAAAAAYGRAQSDLLQSKVTLVKTEARLGLLRLVAALLAAATVVILLGTAWALLNVALAQWLASMTALAGFGFIAVAMLNLLFAALLYGAVRRNLALLANSPAASWLVP